MNEEDKFSILVITTIVLMLGIIFLFSTIINQSETIIKQEETINKINEARIKAENKSCCQVIQERYINKRLSEDGLRFIDEEQPRIISCSDEYDYLGGEIIKWKN